MAEAIEVKKVPWSDKEENLTTVNSVEDLIK